MKYLSPKDRRNFKRTCQLFAKYIQNYEKVRYTKLLHINNKPRFDEFIQRGIDQARSAKKPKIEKYLTKTLSEGLYANSHEGRHRRRR